MNTVTATMTDNKTYLKTTTYKTTATQTQQVLETGLSDCLGKVKFHSGLRSFVPLISSSYLVQNKLADVAW
jgi:hypothetical protein